MPNQAENQTQNQRQPKPHHAKPKHNYQNKLSAQDLLKSGNPHPSRTLPSYTWAHRSICQCKLRIDKVYVLISVQTPARAGSTKNHTGPLRFPMILHIKCDIPAKGVSHAGLPHFTSAPPWPIPSSRTRPGFLQGPVRAASQAARARGLKARSHS